MIMVDAFRHHPYFFFTLVISTVLCLAVALATPTRRGDAAAAPPRLSLRRLSLALAWALSALSRSLFRSLSTLLVLGRWLAHHDLRPTTLRQVVKAPKDTCLSKRDALSYARCDTPYRISHIGAITKAASLAGVV